MRRFAALLAVALLLAASAPSAQETSEASEAATTADAANEDDGRFGHRHQVGLRAGLVGGYRMIFRYDESPFCSDFDPKKTVKDQQKFCGHAAPLAIDLALSYALLDSIEPFLWARFGLGAEAKTDTDPVVILGAGARIYTMSDSAFKIFIEPAIGMELEAGRGSAEYQANDPEYKRDIVFHLAAGPQLDLAKHFGVYADAGITTGILRSIHSTLEIQLGVQARFP
jgi:opacity protein-like surface antigen